MSQKLRNDKIGQLTHSAGNINMIASSANPAFLTIGGQQYKVSSTLVVALPSMTANSRYQVFAVQSGGVVSLVISQNENSVGPVGYSRWKLVGSLYSNNTLVFGSFVNIKGVPVTNEIPYTPALTSSGGGNITLNATGVINPSGFWMRNGNQVKVYFGLRNGTGGSASGAAGGVKIGLPTNLVASGRTSDGNFGNFVTTGGAFKGGGGADSFDYYFVYDLITVTPVKPATGNTWQVSDMIAQVSLNFDGTFGIVGWTNTPIEDL
jgi:hypothetical protein